LLGLKRMHTMLLTVWCSVLVTWHTHNLCVTSAASCELCSPPTIVE